MRSFYYNFINEYGTYEFLDATPCVAYAFEIGRFLYSVNVNIDTFNEVLKNIKVVDADKASCEKALKGGAPAVRMNGFIGSYSFPILKNIIKSAILLEFDKNEEFARKIIEFSYTQVIWSDKRLLEHFEEGTWLLEPRSVISRITLCQETAEGDWYIESELFPKYKEQSIPYCIVKYSELSVGFLYVKTDNPKEEIRRILEGFLEWV
jgi:hypothetical protein